MCPLTFTIINPFLCLDNFPVQPERSGYLSQSNLVHCEKIFTAIWGRQQPVSFVCLNLKWNLFAKRQFVSCKLNRQDCICFEIIKLQWASNKKFHAQMKNKILVKRIQFLYAFILRWQRSELNVYYTTFLHCYPGMYLILTYF